MMKLYYAPGACSQAPHILMHEIGLSHDAAQVHFPSKNLDDGSSYFEVNPKGVVPALRLDSGEVLTENAVILQYLGDRAGSPVILPPPGDFRRYRVLEQVNFITTELHKPFGLLFKASGTGASEEIRQFVRDYIVQRLDHVETRLGSRPFLMGDELTLPDPYLFVIAGWIIKHQLGLDRWPNLKAFRERMLERPAVRHVMRFEGLLQEEAAG
jgi:glutathione S-transferase